MLFRSLFEVNFTDDIFVSGTFSTSATVLWIADMSVSFNAIDPLIPAKVYNLKKYSENVTVRSEITTFF